MRLRFKMNIIMGCTALLLAAIFYILSWNTIVNQVERNEKKEAVESVARIDKLICADIKNLASVNADWAFWDDTYLFMAGKMPGYITDNLTDTGITNLNINIMLFMDVSGGIKYGKCVDLAKGCEITLPGDVIHIFASDRSITGNRDAGKCISGIKQAGSQVLLFSSRPVTMTDMKGTPNGTLVVARFMDGKYIQRIENFSGMTIELQKSTAYPDLSRLGFEKITGGNLSGKPIFFKFADSGNIVCRFPVCTMSDTMKSELQVRIPRNLFINTVSMLRIYTATIILCGFMILFLCGLLLQKMIVARIERLNRFVSNVGRTLNLTSRISKKGKDEITDLAGSIAGLLGKLGDTHKRLKSNEERLKLALEGSNEAIWDYDAEKQVFFADSSFTGLIGYTEKQLKNHTGLWRKIIHPGDKETVNKSCREHMDGLVPLFDTECRVMVKDGSYKWMQVRGKVIEKTDDGRPARMVGTISDITMRKQDEEYIRYLSLYDKLTGLCNRACFEQELYKLYDSEALPFAIVLGDLNGLKITNDVFGHEAGDKLLQAISSILVRAFREGDIAARIGGDEFAVIMPGADDETARGCMLKVKEICGESAKQPIEPSIAMGFSTVQDHSQTVLQHMKIAEDRMYRQKLLEGRAIRNLIMSSLMEMYYVKRGRDEAHTESLYRSCLVIARNTGLLEKTEEDLALLAALHDIGEISLPEGLLDKSGKLEPAEWDTVKRHPETGYRIAESAPELSHIADAILTHHEHYDGSGYPQGLKGEEITVVSRIFAIADAYEAITHDRPYRKAMSRDEAVEELRRCAGTQFDPYFIEPFIAGLENSMSYTNCS